MHSAALAPFTRGWRGILLLAVVLLLGLWAVHERHCTYGYEQGICKEVQDVKEELAHRGSNLLAYRAAFSSENGSIVVSPTEAVITFPPADPNLQGYHFRGECPLPDFPKAGFGTSNYAFPDRCGDYWTYQWMAFVWLPMEKIADRYRLPIQEASGSMDGFSLEAELWLDSALSSGEGALADEMRGAEADVDQLRGHAGLADSLPGMRVTSSLEDGSVVIRLTGREAVERVFGQRRRWVLLSWPTKEAAYGNYGWVWVSYRP